MQHLLPFYARAPVRNFRRATLLHIRAFRATFHVGTTINVSMWKELLLDCPLWGLTAFNSSVGSLCQRDHQQRYVAITFPSSLLSFLSSVKAIHSSFTTQSSRFRKSDSPWTAVRTCHNRLLSCGFFLMQPIREA